MKRSTKTVDRKLAAKIANEFEEGAQKKRTLLQARRVLAELHRQISGDELAHTSFRTFVNSWIERKTPEIAPTTLSFYRNIAGKLIDFLGETADQDLGEVSRDDITRFRNQEAKRFAPQTVNHEIKFVRMVFRAAREDGLLADNPAEFVKIVRGRDTTERAPFALAQLRAILSVADQEWRSMIMFGLYTGQRLSDIALLTWANIDLERNELRIVARKTGKRVLIPLASPLARLLEAMPLSDNPTAPLHPRANAL